MDIEQIKQALRKERVSSKVVKPSDWLSSGSTVLNLACSGNIHGALAKGYYFWMVGDSSSGKTFLTLTMLAEATINRNFDDYDLIYDDVERGALMDVEKYFGEKLAKRIQPPAIDENGPVYSRQVEEFYYMLDDHLKKVEAGKANPFIWIEDSMDALSTRYEGEKFDEKKKASRAGNKPKGEFGDGKAKINSTWIRGVIPRLAETGSILIIVSQTRDNINASMFESKSTHAGGRSLKFYAGWQLWSSVGKSITKEIKGKKRQLGIICNVAIRKNRLTGQETTGDTVVKLPIYRSYGIDDVGSCVDYLVDEGHWTKNGGSINATELTFNGRRDKLIKHIEENDLDVELRVTVKKVWDEIQEACALDRQSRYV